MGIKIFFLKIAPAIVLSVLALAIPEIIMGSTPVSRADQWLFEFLFYGSGVLLIREIIIKFKLGWASVIILGLAFGLTEEGLLLQSVFNPGFLNLDLSFGRVGGVNWVWAQFIVGYHALFSISIPVFLAELIFRKRQNLPWLSKVWFWIICVVFAFSSLSFYLIFHNMSDFKTTPSHYLIALAIIIVLVLIAFRIRINQQVKTESKPYLSVVTGLIAFIGSFMWLYGIRLVFTKGGGFMPWVIQLFGLVALIVFVAILTRWSKWKWGVLNQFSILCGGLAAGLLFGSSILLQQGNKLDIYSQVVFILGTIILMVLLGKKLKREVSEINTESI
jgi:hypothetical protein